MKKIYILGAALTMAASFYATSNAEAAVACGPRGCVAARPAYRVYRPAPRVYVAPRPVGRCYWRGGVRVCR